MLGRSLHNEQGLPQDCPQYRSLSPPPRFATPHSASWSGPGGSPERGLPVPRSFAYCRFPCRTRDSWNPAADRIGSRVLRHVPGPEFGRVQGQRIARDHLYACPGWISLRRRRAVGFSSAGERIKWGDPLSRVTTQVRAQDTETTFLPSTKWPLQTWVYRYGVK